MYSNILFNLGVIIPGNAWYITMDGNANGRSLFTPVKSNYAKNIFNRNQTLNYNEGWPAQDRRKRALIPILLGVMKRMHFAPARELIW